jgi:hypothetical protein
VSASREGDDDIEMDKADRLSRGGAVMTLGCVRGLAAPTAAVEAQTSTVKPMSVKAGLNVERGPGLWHGVFLFIVHHCSSALAD